MQSLNLTQGFWAFTSGGALNLNPELIVNGGFDTNDLTGWNLEAGANVDASTGQSVMTVTGNNNRGIWQSFPTTVGKQYRLSLDTGTGTFALFVARVGTAAGVGDILSEAVPADTPGQTFTFVATEATSYLTLRPNSTVDDAVATFDNLSVKGA